MSSRVKLLIWIPAELDEEVTEFAKDKFCLRPDGYRQVIVKGLEAHKKEKGEREKKETERG